MIDMLSLIAGGFQIAGGLTGLFGANKAANALEDQAAFTLQLGQEKSQWATELAAIDAELLLQRGEDEYEIALFNARQAEENAKFAARAGAIDLMDAERRWSEQIKNVRAQFAASGVLLTDTPIAVLAEQSAEAEKDKYRIRLATEAATSKALGEAEIFTLQGTRARAAAQRQADARLRAGEIESASSLLTAGINAEAAETQADTARLSGLGSLLSAGGSALGSYLTYRNRVPSRLV